MTNTVIPYNNFPKQYSHAGGAKNARENFPKHDAKAPQVALRRVNALEDAFKSHPPHGKHAFRRLAVVVASSDPAGETKVCDLEDALVCEEHVPARNVTVNKTFACEVPELGEEANAECSR